MQTALVIAIVIKTSWKNTKTYRPNTPANDTIAADHVHVKLYTVHGFVWHIVDKGRTHFFLKRSSSKNWIAFSPKNSIGR